MPMPALDELSKTISEFYINSGDFNGYPLNSIVRSVGDLDKARLLVRNMIQDGLINCAFYSVSLNPHIKRMPDLSVSEQVSILQSEDPAGVCCYPSKQVVRKHADLSAYHDKPFTRELALGAAQLDWVSFDLSVLERYKADPRYLFQFDDYSGLICINDDAYEDPTFPERDKAFLQSFGLGYIDGHRVALVFYRYLHDLSAEHQQYWNSFRTEKKAKILKEYYQNSVAGGFADSVSYFTAMFAEISAINQACKMMEMPNLFRNEYADSIPIEMTMFTKPTLANFNAFILALDKALSENINKKFFDGQIELEWEKERPDGKVVVGQKGTVSLLEEWLRKKIRWNDEEGAISAMIAPLKEVRKLRQSPAHKVEENKYDIAYDEKRGEILKSSYLSLMHIRKTFLRHPAVRDIELPWYLRKGNIRYY